MNNYNPERSDPSFRIPHSAFRIKKAELFSSAFFTEFQI